MRDSRSETVLARLRTIFTLLRDDPRSDEELLRRFAEDHDEDAFSTVVGRHAPLVWRTCCRELGDGPDAEDAFQVTFLTLARWAKKLRRWELAGWLFQVARRSALNVRAAAERRRKLEHNGTVEVESGRWEDLAQAETYRLLDEELAELPERLRAPLVLRYLEGKTLEEVARILGCSRQAISKRLARAEGILRERLSCRGVTIGAGAVAGLLVGTRVGEATVRSRLIAETTRAAVAFCAGTLDNQASQAALALLPGKAVWSLKSWLLVLLGAGFLLAGVVGWQAIPSVPATPSSSVGGPEAAPGRTVAPRPAVRPAPAGPVVVGEVTDADGKPVSKAEVVVLVSGNSEPWLPLDSDRPVWKGRTKENGQFRARLPAKFSANSPGGLWIRLLASGDGTIGVAAATYQAEGPPMKVRLGKNDPLSQTVMDANGRPVVGARVRIWQIGSVWVRPSAEADRDPEPVADCWPKPVVTNKDGEFSFPGLGGLSTVVAEVLAPECARTDTLLSGPGVVKKIQVRRPKWLSGRVRAADTGKPVAGAAIGYPLKVPTPDSYLPLVFHRVGRDGSFRIPLPSDDHVMKLIVQPPAVSRLGPLVHLVDLDGRQQADVQLSLPSADE